MNRQYDSQPDLTVDRTCVYRIRMETDRGGIDLELYPEHAPVTVNNFLFPRR